eukprot:s3728_g1.t1
MDSGLPDLHCELQISVGTAGRPQAPIEIWRVPVEEPEAEPFSCVYFHNVPFEDLLPLFERAGPVRAMRLFRLLDGRSRGQGLCQFTTSGAASKAVQILTGCFLANPLNESSKDSRELFVKIHQGSTDILSSSKVVLLSENIGGATERKNLD